jgi:hypothetical protein
MACQRMTATLLIASQIVATGRRWEVAPNLRLLIPLQAFRQRPRPTTANGKHAGQEAEYKRDACIDAIFHHDRVATSCRTEKITDNGFVSIRKPSSSRTPRLRL